MNHFHFSDSVSLFRLHFPFHHFFQSSETKSFSTFCHLKRITYMRRTRAYANELLMMFLWGEQCFWIFWPTFSIYTRSLFGACIYDIYVYVYIYARISLRYQYLKSIFFACVKLRVYPPAWMNISLQMHIWIHE